jgi:hydrophobic/amphiphilic exporter-1 (mainly G- bacteria), HAE1 family
MKISDISIKRPVTTTMLVLLVVLLGFISYNEVSIDLFPDMVYPGAAVISQYQGVGPEEIENMVTKPLEGAISTVSNINNLSSTSSKGQSIILAEFNWGTDMDMATMDMRERIDLVKDILPDDVEKPIIVKFDPSMMPILYLGVSADMSLADLKKYIETNVSPGLERIEGVAAVNLSGGKEREILVTIDQTKLNNYNLSFSNIINTLMMENVNISGGNVKRGNSDILIRVTGKFKDINEIKKLLIPGPTGTIPLENIAEVRDTFKELNSITRLDGKPSMGLTIQKQTDANTVEVSRKVNEELKKIIGHSKDSLLITPIMDQARYIEKTITNVGRNAILGGILSVIILLIFLRNIRSTLIIATAIPISVITTFMLIYFGNLTINMMTLGGLALGIGMLVDNSIVVLENIFRYNSEGYGLIDSARKGSQEVGMAITASTITTAVVFLPVVFVGGLASQLFKELALTVTFSLLASLIVSLTLIPVMASKILKVKSREKEKSGFIDSLKIFYKNSLEWSLSHRYLVIVLSLLVLIGSIFLVPMIGTEFIPEMDTGEFIITANLPLGTSLEETDDTAKLIEEELLKLDEIESLLTSIGSSDTMYGGGGSTEVASFQVKLKNLKERKRSTNEIIEELRNCLRFPDAEISIDTQGIGLGMIGGGSPVSLTIKGDDLNVLEEKTIEIKNIMANIEGLREIEDTISEGRPEMHISINRTLASEFGLMLSQIGSVIKTAVKGTIASRYEVGGEEYDISVRLNKEEVDTIEQIKDLLIPSPTGARVPLRRIADFSIEKGPRSILRENQVRYVNISADIYNIDLGNAMNKIKEQIEGNIKLPPGYQLEYTGQYREMEDAFWDLFMAFLLAIVLVYMVMASQFESLLHPFVVMFTVPMAVIGVILGLFITGKTLSVVAIIGIIMLAGIVVNNAIVLVDYINTLRKKGRTIHDAILEAGPVRLRPILMTALTTILGLFPLALGIGEGSEVQSPMAIVVIGGLSAATLLTLYLVPVLYSIFTELSGKISNKFNWSAI